LKYGKHYHPDGLTADHAMGMIEDAWTQSMRGSSTEILFTHFAASTNQREFN